jgi:hypothetical protein
MTAKTKETPLSDLEIAEIAEVIQRARDTLAEVKVVTADDEVAQKREKL